MCLDPCCLQRASERQMSICIFGWSAVFEKTSLERHDYLQKASIEVSSSLGHLLHKVIIAQGCLFGQFGSIWCQFGVFRVVFESFSCNCFRMVCVQFRIVLGWVWHRLNICIFIKQFLLCFCVFGRRRRNAVFVAIDRLIGRCAGRN